MSLKVKVGDVVRAEQTIGRWSNLHVRPAMSMTLALVIRAILPILENYRKLSSECQKGYEDIRVTVVPPPLEEGEQPTVSDETMNFLKDKFQEVVEKPLRELLDTEVELDGIGTIKLSKICKGKIKPTLQELVAVHWLVENDLEEDGDDYDEAEPLSRPKGGQNA